MKHHLLMGSRRSLNEALNQAQTLDTVKVAAKPLAKLQQGSATAGNVETSVT
jgi:hypothetical protein